MAMWTEFKAEVHFFSTAKGGRTGAVLSGYRPLFDFGVTQEDGQRVYNDAQLFLEDGDQAQPGDIREVRVKPFHPELLAGVLRPGLQFAITEGARVVGKGRVLKRLR